MDRPEKKDEVLDVFSIDSAERVFAANKGFNSAHALYEAYLKEEFSVEKIIFNYFKRFKHQETINYIKKFNKCYKEER